MIGCHVGHHAHISQVIPQPGPHHPAPGRLKHRIVHGGVPQHKTRALRPGTVSLVHKAVLDIDAVGGCIPDLPAVCSHNMSDQAGRGGLSVGAGHRHNGDPPGMNRWKQHVHHRCRHVPGFSLCGIQMHAKARPAVDFDDRSPVFIKGFGQVRRYYIDTADIQIDDFGNPLGHEYIVRMDRFGHILGNTAGA